VAPCDAPPSQEIELSLPPEWVAAAIDSAEIEQQQQQQQ
jgi:hypothetical protein